LLSFFGEFVKLLKATISYFLSVWPFVRPSAWKTRLPRDGVSLKVVFGKYAEKIQVLLKSDKKNRYFT